MLFGEIQGEEDHLETGQHCAWSIIQGMPGKMRTMRQILGMLALIFSCGLLFWGSWPFPVHSKSVPLPPDRRLALAWPRTVRAGDRGSIRLQVDRGLAAQPKIASAASQVRMATTNEMAAARLEFTGLQFSPGEQISQPLRPGYPVTFEWSFRPEEDGIYTGVAWLYLIAVPQAGGPETLTPVLASEISLHVIDLRGVSGPTARLLGAGGLILGGLLCLDGALAWLRRRAWRHAGIHAEHDIREP
jgi:hypothetical protein